MRRPGLPLLPILALALAGLLTAPGVAADDWPVFRRDAAHSGSDGSAPRADEETVRWRAPTGDKKVHSSPAVVNGTVYVGSMNGRMFAFDAATGDERWSFETGGPVQGSPAVAGGVVYVTSRDGWLYALAAETGAVRWKYASDAIFAYSSPTVARGVVFVAAYDGKVHAVDAATGKKKWAVTLHEDDPHQPLTALGGRIDSSPTVAQGKVIVGGPGGLYALRIQDGSQVWNLSTAGHAESGAVESSPAFADGVVYVGANDGKLRAVTAGTGEVRWVFNASDGIYSSPAVADGVVHVGSLDGHVYAVDAETGAARWSFKTGATVYASPAVTGGVVYIGSDDDHLYALDAATGALVWKYQLPDDVFSSPAIADGVLYVGSNDGHVYALNAGWGRDGASSSVYTDGTIDRNGLPAPGTVVALAAVVAVAALLRRRR